MKSIDKYFRQLKNQPQHKKSSHKTIMTEALRTFSSGLDPDLNVMAMFTEKVDKQLAKYLVCRYLEDFAIENVAEKNTLKQLVFLEVLQINSLQVQMNAVRKASNIVPQQILDAIHKNIKEIKDLKAQLGIRKQEEDKSDAFKALESLQRKAGVWRNNNQGSRTLCCPHCGKFTLLRIRTDVWESLKHPFFRDRILYNKHAFALLGANKLTKMDVAKILDEDAQSTDYVEWLLEKVQIKVVRETEQVATEVVLADVVPVDVVPVEYSPVQHFPPTEIMLPAEQSPATEPVTPVVLDSGK